MKNTNVISLRTRRPIDEDKTTFVSTGQTSENGLEVFIAVVEDGYGNISKVEFPGGDFFRLYAPLELEHGR